ncbi:uncharacterized protein [Hetaerina americana]|uniref:uncharacterized protein n=1 Tax=Hetaerina americana TaxID=62018 RepID=UPI003A7F45BB
MIEKREGNTSPITAHGIHESISTISLETIDLYLKQLEAQKLQAQADISRSFSQLTSLINAREKQLLRQVDAIHDHLILILQSRKTFCPDAIASCENKDKELQLKEQEAEGSLDDDKSCNAKASPGIDVSIDTKELEDQILTVGKVEMTGTSFMHLSEDNEAFVFPCRVQNYQETSQDHMLLYKSLETTESLNSSCVKSEGTVLVSREMESTSNMDIASPVVLSAKAVSPDVSSSDSHMQENPEGNNGEGSVNLGKEKEYIDASDDGQFLRKLSEERSEDVQHWMREILNETNSEPTSCDPERFDLFTVLKCNLSKEDIKHEKLKVCTERQCTSRVSAMDHALERDSVPCLKVDPDHLIQQATPAVTAVPSECDLIE